MRAAVAPGKPELEARLDRVFRILERTPDPLQSPFGFEFAPMDGEAHLEAWRRFAEEAAAGRVHQDVVLYVHIPFCARMCSFCLEAAVLARGKGLVDDYVRALRREIALHRPLLAPLRISTLHFGGGTPSVLSEGQLESLLSDLFDAFRRAPGFQVGFEAHPATITRGKLEVLRRYGTDRISYGVQTFTTEVLRRINRTDQTTENVQRAVRLTREVGLAAMNLDLLAGLPGETEDSFGESVRQALALGPDALSVNRFLAENSPLWGVGYSPDPEEDARAGRMLLLADRIIRETRPPTWPKVPLEVPGYGAQYVWDESGNARNYYQEDMIGPASVLALGHGPMGHIHGGLFSTAAGRVKDYVEALAGAGRPPPMLAAAGSMRFESAFWFADRATRDAVSAREFEQVFRVPLVRAFGRELLHLVEAGLLREREGRLTKPAHPRFHMQHLLAFLACPESELESRLASLPPHASGSRKALSVVEAGDRLEAAAAGAVAVSARPEEDAAARQYRQIPGEFPSSMFWCRLAIRAQYARRRHEGPLLDRI